MGVIGVPELLIVLFIAGAGIAALVAIVRVLGNVGGPKNCPHCGKPLR